MKKLFLLISISILLAGCSNSHEGESVLQNEAESKYSITEDATEEGKEPELDSKKEDWSLVENKQDMEWSNTLREQGNLNFTLDGCDGYITIKNSEIEGSMYISHMEVGFGELAEPYVINDYDASFEKLSTLDIDNDGKDELILFFNTHGNGGQGTYEIILCKKEEKSIVGTTLSEHIDRNEFNIKAVFTSDKKIDLLREDGTTVGQLKIVNDYYDFLYDDRELYRSTEGKTDVIYDFAIVQWNGKNRLMIYQYVWGYGHSDGIADILSIVNMEQIPFHLEKQWIHCTYSDAVRLEE